MSKKTPTLTASTMRGIAREFLEILGRGDQRALKEFRAKLDHPESLVCPEPLVKKDTPTIQPDDPSPTEGVGRVTKQFDGFVAELEELYKEAFSECNDYPTKDAFCAKARGLVRHYISSVVETLVSDRQELTERLAASFTGGKVKPEPRKRERAVMMTENEEGSLFDVLSQLQGMGLDIKGAAEARRQHEAEEGDAETVQVLDAIIDELEEDK